jgi:FkbM family methyltransferase
VTALRDTVRLRLPGALALYRRHVAPRLTRYRRHFDLSAWAAQGPAVVAQAGLHAIRFEPDGIWIEDTDGDLWAYTPGLFGSALGAEFGIDYERREIDLLAQHLPAGGVLVDVGANVGRHTIKLARRVEGLTVLAFEPVRRTRATLCRNLERNGVADRVEVHGLALADADRTLRITTGFQAANFVVPDGAVAAPAGVEEVRARPLDDVLDERGAAHVDAIKCDVEGAELAVLRGARRTLARDRPALLVEVDERWAARYGHRGADVAELLRGHGYRGEPVAGTTNMVFLPEGARR